MSDFKPKMHQIRFRLGLYSAPLDPLAGFKGPTSKGREGKGREREREGKEREREEEEKGKGRGGAKGRKGKAFPLL